VQKVRTIYQSTAKEFGIERDMRSNKVRGLDAAEPKIGPAHPRAELNPVRELKLQTVETIRYERKEDERKRAAIFGRIGENFKFTSRHSAATDRAHAFAVADLSGIAQEHRAIATVNRSVEQAIHATRHHEATRTIVASTGAAIGRAIPQIARAAQAIDRNAAQERAAAQAKAEAAAQAKAEAAAQAKAEAAEPRIIGRNEMAKLKAIEIARQKRELKINSELTPSAEPLKTPLESPAVSPHTIALPDPVKTLVEVFTASYEAFKKWVSLQAGKLREIKLDNSDHQGWVKKADEHHAVQHLGGEGYAIHEQAKLSQPLIEGQYAEVKYRDGRGVVKVIDKTLSKGKGKGIAD
jgi:hypothetical protein